MVTTNAGAPDATGPQGPGRKNPKGRRWIAVGFFLSLLINLFVVGFVLGRILHPEFMFGGGAYVREFGPVAGHAIQRLIGQLDQADRQAVMDALKGHADSFTSLNQDLRQQRQLLIKLLRAENFDRKAVDDALAELRRRSDALQAAMESAITDAVEKLPASARQHLAE